MANAIQITR